MPTVASELGRVVSALEDLASQEELLVNAGDYAEVNAVQERMAPLVRFVVEGMAAADASLQRRIAFLVTRRARTQQRLTVELEKIREEIVQLDLNRRRVAQVAPAYGFRRAESVTRQLSVRS